MTMDNKNAPVSEDQPNIAKTILSMTPEGKDYWERMQNAIKVDCPVKKVNLSLEQPSALAALYLLCDIDGPKKLKEVAKMDDLNDNTVLFFAPQHIVELGHFAQALITIAEYIDSMSVRSSDNTVPRLMRVMSITPRFAEYLESVDAICNISYKHIEKENTRMVKLIMGRISQLLRYIPFVTYADLDSFSQAAIDWFKSMGAEGYTEIMRKVTLKLQELRNAIPTEDENFIPEKPPFEQFISNAYDEIGKLDSRCAALKVEDVQAYRKLFMDVNEAKNRIGFEGGRIIIDEDKEPEEKEKMQDELDRVLQRCDNIHSAMAQRKELADREDEEDI